MINNVAIKGALRAALFEQDDRPALLLWSAGEDRFVRADEQFGLYLRLPSETRFFDGEFADEVALHRPLRQCSQNLAALDHLIAAMDPDYEPDLRTEHLREAARLRTLLQEVAQFTQARLLGRPLPPTALVRDAVELCDINELQSEGELFRLIKAASESGQLARTVDAVTKCLREVLEEPEPSGPTDREFEQAERDVLDSGVVATYVEAVVRGRPEIWDAFLSSAEWRGDILGSEVLSRRFLLSLRMTLERVPHEGGAPETGAAPWVPPAQSWPLSDYGFNLNGMPDGTFKLGKPVLARGRLRRKMEGKNRVKLGDAIDYPILDLLNLTPEALQLNRAYSRIPSEQVRRHILGLVESLVDIKV